MKDSVDERPRADRGGGSSRGRLLFAARPAVALALAAGSALMLLHWLTYRVGSRTESPEFIKTIAPTNAGAAAPSASPAPAGAGLKRVLEEKITVERPERFLDGEEYTLSCELALVNGETVPSASFAEGFAAVIDRPGAPASGRPGPPEEPLKESHTSFARFGLESDDMTFALVSPRVQPLPAREGERAVWDWKVRLKDGARDRVSFTLRLEVVWRPATPGGGEIVRNVWEKNFANIPVGLPVEVKASKYGSLAGGLAALGVFALPGLGRRRLEEEHGTLAVGPAAGGDAPPEAEADEVLCTVYARREARPGDSFLVQAFAHLAEQAGELAARALKSDESAEERGSEPLDAPVARGSRLTFTLQTPGLEIDEPSQTFVWKGEVRLVQFGVTVPADCAPKNLVGKLTVCQESVPVGHVRFTLNVVAAQPATPPPPAQGEPAGGFVRYRQAFISYSSKDRAEVLRRLQMLRLVKLNFRQDLLDIEPGQEWEQLLYRWIDESDVFFLFWSRAAKESEWVERELLYALRRKGEREDSPPEIVPVIIEGPPPVAPPPYLAARHFNDTFLYFVRVEEQLKAARDR